MWRIRAEGIEPIWHNKVPNWFSFLVAEKDGAEVGDEIKLSYNDEDFQFDVKCIITQCDWEEAEDEEII